MTSHASSSTYLRRRLERLLAVPGAAVRAEQAPHDARRGGRASSRPAPRVAAPGAGRPRRSGEGVCLGLSREPVVSFRHGEQAGYIGSGECRSTPAPRRRPFMRPDVPPRRGRGDDLRGLLVLRVPAARGARPAFLRVPAGLRARPLRRLARGPEGSPVSRGPARDAGHRGALRARRHLRDPDVRRRARGARRPTCRRSSRGSSSGSSRTLWQAFHFKPPDDDERARDGPARTSSRPSSRASSAPRASPSSARSATWRSSSARSSCPVFALYLLIDFDRIVERRRPARAAPVRSRRWPTWPGRSTRRSGGYVRGQLTANIVLGALYATGLRFVDIRLAVPIGVLTGMLAFVPYIGFGCGLHAGGVDGDPRLAGPRTVCSACSR